MKTKYKIISKSKFTIFIITMTILFTASVLFLIDKKEAHSSYYYAEHENFQVLQGDTLWEIAREYLSPGEDIREVIYDIKKLNNMDTGYIYPGDIIKIPGKK